MSAFQVIIGTGCLIFLPFALEYGGLFDCPLVLYSTIAGAAAILLIIIVVVACVVRKQRIKEKKKKEETSNQPENLQLPIRSVYPGYLEPPAAAVGHVSK